MKAHRNKQKSLSISNKSNRLQRKSQSKRKTNNTLSTLQEKDKQKNKFANLSKTLNFSKPQRKSTSSSTKCPYKNKTGLSSNKSSTKTKRKPLKKQQKSVSKLRSDYNEAITKVFNVLDIFSRGTISQANISRWVPDAALYFLGSVFQKIRNQRIVMNLEQFQSECLKIFEKSAQSDVKCFIQNIFKHDNFNDEKISMDGQIKQTLQSHVEDRFTFLIEGETSFRQSKNQKRSILPLQQKAENNMDNHDKFLIEDLQKNNRLKVQKTKIAPLNNINSFQNVSVRNQHRKIVDTENLPLQMKQPANSSTIAHSNGFQSPFFQGSISSVLARTVSNRRRQHLASEKGDRIDKLSMRLQDFIKETAARIQRSKNCRIDL